MYRRILVPLEGSPVAAQIVPWVGVLAASTRSTVILIRALEPVRELLVSQAAEPSIDDQMAIRREQAMEALSPAKRQLSAAGIAVERVVRFAHPADAILNTVEQEQIDLIAMATHGRTGLARWVYGSVMNAVLKQGHTPVLVIRGRDGPPEQSPRLNRILVPLDGSTLAETALPHARTLALAHAADVVLFAIWDTFAHTLTTYPRNEIETEIHEKHEVAKQYLIAQAGVLQAAGVCARWQLQSGLVVESIAEAAKQQGTSLIVMSTHGRRGLNRWLAGSVADEVLQVTSVPVLLVRAPNVEETSG